MIKLFFPYAFIFFFLCSQVASPPPKGDTCTNDNDCFVQNYCNAQTKLCQHKSIFPFNSSTIIGLICIALGSALSNAGGIGGGGLLIPILLFLLHFYTHEAIPVSKLMIFSGAITAFVLGFQQKHPTRNSITIDYNIPLLLVPLLLFGTMVGVTLNKITPPWLILVCLTLVLTINTYKTISKGWSLYKKENKEMKELRFEKKSSSEQSSLSSLKINEKNENVQLFQPEKSRIQNQSTESITENSFNKGKIIFYYCKSRQFGDN